MDEREMAKQLFGTTEQSTGVMQALKEAVQAVAPGLNWQEFKGDVAAEVVHQVSQGAHEIAAALFKHADPFVMYPRGTREDHGVHGPQVENQGTEPPENKLGGKGMSM